MYVSQCLCTINEPTVSFTKQLFCAVVPLSLFAFVFVFVIINQAVHCVHLEIKSTTWEITKSIVLTSAEMVRASIDGWLMYVAA